MTLAEPILVVFAQSSGMKQQQAEFPSASLGIAKYQFQSC